VLKKIYKLKLINILMKPKKIYLKLLNIRCIVNAIHVVIIVIIRKKTMMRMRMMMMKMRMMRKRMMSKRMIRKRGIRKMSNFRRKKDKNIGNLRHQKII
jgi:hypothetical protein